MEADKLQLKADREALDDQKKAFEEEKEGLKAFVDVTYPLHSTVFNSALGDVYTKLLNYGKHLGLVAGFKLHESEDADVSKEASLEGSAVVGDGGQKAKKAKKAKKGKGDGTRASKPSSDV
ncbi:hypothetical protein Hanom_Chr12g01144741 [Helianthus anomalus]